MKYKIKQIIIDDVPIRYTIPANNKVKSIFFLGLGQQGKNLIWVADAAPSDMVIVEAIPYTNKKTTENMLEFGVETARHIFKEFNIRDLNVFCESQSSPAVVLACHRYSMLPQSIICITPLGFNYNQLGKTSRQRTNRLICNSVRFWLSKQQKLSDKANRETFKYAIIKHSFTPRITMQALELAANLNLQNEAENLAKKIPIHIFASINDEHFTYASIAKQLGPDTFIHLHTLRGGHLNRATPKGIAQLELVLQHMYSDTTQLLQ